MAVTNQDAPGLLQRDLETRGGPALSQPSGSFDATLSCRIAVPSSHTLSATPSGRSRSTSRSQEPSSCHVRNREYTLSKEP